MSEVQFDRTDKDDGGTNGPVRALHVLEALAGMRQPANLDTIAARTGLPKTKAYRALRALQDEGYVDHTGRTGYRIGSRGISLAALIGPRPALSQRARPILNRLATEAGETATLHLRSGVYRVLVLGAEAAKADLRHVIRVGERAPLTNGCSGTVILANLPASETNTILANNSAGGRRLTPRVLRRIRDDGYAITHSANHVGVSGIAAALLDPADGYALGSVAIAGPTHRLPDAALRKFIGPLTAAIRDLTPRLAAILGPHASIRQEALDVVIQDFVED